MAVGKLSQLQLLAIVITALLFLSMYSLRSAGNPLIMPDTSNTTSTHLTGSSTLVENATLILAEKLSSDSKELETTTISWNHIFNNKTRAKMLETMDNEADRKTIYDKILNSTVKPSLALRTFATPSATRLLSLAIVEPRSHPNLRGVLYNIAHTYGGTEAVLYIFHGIANADHVRDITKDWVNVQLINMDIENLPTPEYNMILTSVGFYDNFQSEFVLIFQTDSIIRKRINSMFFRYDWVGAPWPWHKSGPDNSGGGGGNGGLSLRRVSAIKKVCKEHGPQKVEPEDWWFKDFINPDRMPVYEIAQRFSVEHQFDENPVGLHQIWRYQSLERMLNWFNMLPGFSEFIVEEK